MKRLLFAILLTGTYASPAAASQLSSERLDVLDQRGYFTPDFKAATHALVQARQGLAQTQTDEKTLTLQIPSVQRQADQAEAATVALRQELVKYDHPEENDFVLLATAFNNSAATPKDQIILAQAYVWTYPTSPHTVEAQQYLLIVQKKLADQDKADKDAEAARVAAHAQLVARAQAHDLSLAEWRDLLRGMSQADLVKLLGQPSAKADQYWFYTGADGWVTKPDGKPKVGMQLNFDAGRVIQVDDKPSLP